MTLTPYLSLATLPEVIANGGKIPLLYYDSTSGSARLVYASTIPGVVLDCDLATRAKIGGGTPTDNATALNAVLATATATNPIHLIFDGASAMRAPLLIPPAGHVTLSGLGWDTGICVMPGSNCSAIQNFPHTQRDEYEVWNPPSRPQAIAGSNVVIRDLRIVGNRGTYPNGNVDGSTDGTLDGYTPTGLQLTPTASPSARGAYDTSYWISGIVLRGLDNVAIDRVWVYDAPTYHVNLYHCTKVWVQGCRLEAADPTFGTPGSLSGNTDGVHVNGGCSYVRVKSCWICSGDDPVAFNIDEGDGATGSDFLAEDITLFNCVSAGRVYGKAARTSKVAFRNYRGTVRWWGVTVGLDSNSIEDCNRSITFEDFEVAVTAPVNGGFLFMLGGNCGLVNLRDIRVVESAASVPVVRVVNGSVIGALHVSEVREHRNASGSAAWPLLLQESGTIKEMSISGFSISDNGTFSDLPNLLEQTGGSITRLWVADLDPNHVAALTSDPTKIAAKLGPGLAASGF